VMMGNFLTTLGAEPEQDRAAFQIHGLNVARQPDNAANPRPDNRSGWLSGTTPEPGEERLAGRDATAGHAAAAGEDASASLEVRLWDPSKQLRFRAKRLRPRPVEEARRPGGPVSA
jgi:biotin synthase